MHIVMRKITVTPKYKIFIILRVDTVAYVFNQNRDPIKFTDKCINLVLPNFFCHQGIF